MKNDSPGAVLILIVLALVLAFAGGGSGPSPPVPPPPPDPEPITVEDKDRVKAGMLAYWRLVGEACVEAKAIEVEAERNEFLAAKQEAARRAATKPIDELLQRASGKGEEFDRKTHDQALQLIEEAARELH